MKQIIVCAFVFIALLASAGCSNEPQSVVASTPASSPAPPLPTIGETANPSAPALNILPAPAASPKPSETPALNAGPLPDLTGNQWYDWDKVGAYPGASVVQCGDRIAFETVKYIDEHECDYILTFADPDGSNSLLTEVESIRNPNYKDGWVYFISNKDNCIFKIKPDGTGLKKVYKAKSSEATTELLLSDLLLVEDRLYFFECIEHRDKAKIGLLSISLNGKDEEIIDEFADKKLNSENYWFGIKYALFYDSGKLYYMDADFGDFKYHVERFDLYQYDIALKTKACIARSLPTIFDKIAVRGDSVYHAYNGEIYMYSLAEGKDTAIIDTKIH